MAFDVRNYASSQPARNNEPASDSSLGARIAISWQDEALELSQPVRDKKVVAGYCFGFGMDRLHSLYCCRVA
jgi:hypothetical protein